MFYAGDGVSDLSAARESDLLFAKKGQGKHYDSRTETSTKNHVDLVTYCAKEDIPFTVFEDFQKIKEVTQDIV